MIKIGSRKLIFSETLICPDNEVIHLDIQVPSEDEPWPLRINFKESLTGDSDQKVKMNLEVDEDGISLATFHNFTSTIGTALSNPAHIANSDSNLPITMLAEVSKLSAAYKITIQIMIKEDSNG